jgi:hypothetical protein
MLPWERHFAQRTAQPRRAADAEHALKGTPGVGWRGSLGRKMISIISCLGGPAKSDNKQRNPRRPYQTQDEPEDDASLILAAEKVIKDQYENREAEAQQTAK